MPFLVGATYTQTEIDEHCPEATSPVVLGDGPGAEHRWAAALRTHQHGREVFARALITVERSRGRIAASRALIECAPHHAA